MDHPIREAHGFGQRPSPQVAYAQWVNACAAAGWAGGRVTEQVPVAGGLGRVTAVSVRACWPSPLVACAAMDGIAFRAASVPDASGTAGRTELPASGFAWVDTGEPIPAGLDTVVPRERVDIGQDGSALISGPIRQGSHVRASGEDFEAGKLLIPAGHRLRPPDLAVAAAAGHGALTVARQPVAAIIPTGNEVRPPGSVPAPGQVIDSNSVMLAARSAEAGALPQVSEIQPDDLPVIAAAVRQAARTADVVLVIAGSSAGRRDHTAAVLDAVGGLVVRGVAVRPGHPVLLGYARREPGAVVPVIGIPGYPLAAAVIFELFAIPLLAALQGMQPPDRERQRVRLACDWTSSAEVEDWVPVALSMVPASPDAMIMATPSRRGSSSISRLVRADAWWPIPIGQARFAHGEDIYVQPLPGAPH